MSSETKFKYGQTVKITGGFYKGHLGVCRKYKGGVRVAAGPILDPQYSLAIDGAYNPGDENWVSEDCLEPEENQEPK